MTQKDDCQTPGYALDPLIAVARNTKINRVWEPACGDGILKKYIVDMMMAECIGTDKKTGTDFFSSKPSIDYDVIITNPPFSEKVKFIQRCIELGKPWALLMESNTISLKSFQELIIPLIPEIGIIWFSPRINFKMPNKKWEGTSHFPVAWFTFNFGFSGNRYLIMDHWSKNYRERFEV